MSDDRTLFNYKRDAAAILKADLHLHTKRGTLYKLVQDYTKHARRLGLRLAWSVKVREQCKRDGCWDGGKYDLEHPLPIRLITDRFVPELDTLENGLAKVGIEQIFDEVPICWVTKGEHKKLNKHFRDKMPDIKEQPDIKVPWEYGTHSIYARYHSVGIRVSEDPPPEYNHRSKKRKRK